MGALNQFLSDNLATLVVAGMMIIVVALVVIAVSLLRREPVDVSSLVTIDLSDQINQLQRAVEHHVDVSAVVTMVRQLDELDEDAIQLLKSYPASVRAAAWLHYINCLGSDLQIAQEALSRAHIRKDLWYDYSVTSQAVLIDGRERHVTNLRAKLDAAIKASGQTGLRAI